MVLGLVFVLLGLCGPSLLLKSVKQKRYEGDVQRGVPDTLGHARALLSRGAHRQALVVARAAAELARSASFQLDAIELIAWCELASNKPSAARDALSWLGASYELDAYCRAAVEDACGQSLWALHILERAAQRKPLPREATLFRIDLCARIRGIEAACRLAVQQAAQLTQKDAARLLDYARAAACPESTLLIVRRAFGATSRHA